MEKLGLSGMGGGYSTLGILKLFIMLFKFRKGEGELKRMDGL